MTQQETVDNIVREVLKTVDNYDGGFLTRDTMALYIRTDVTKYVKQFFESNSIDVEEVDLFGPNDDGYAVDEDIDEDED